MTCTNPLLVWTTFTLSLWMWQTWVCGRLGFFSQVLQVHLFGVSRSLGYTQLGLWQCSIPVFEALFPDPHDSSIQQLLFQLCEWHALTKLWLHMDNLLALLQQSLHGLGDQLRHFNETSVRNSTPTNYPRKLHAGREGKLPMWMLVADRKHPIQPCFQNPSISTCTNSMPLVTMSKWSRHLGQRTHTPPRS